MAGYIMNLDSTQSLEMYIKNGIYSTKLSNPRNNNWMTHHEATSADYATMKPGDNIYFFIKRKIYGIGELVYLKGDCKFLNYFKANKPENYSYNSIKDDLLWDEGAHSVNQRWICVFKPSPYFFQNGIDMDEALASNPSKFRNLRAFWKLSFIKIDDEENQALKDVILKNNQEALFDPENKTFTSEYIPVHIEISKKLEQNDDYLFNLNEIVFSCAEDSRLRHEMALETAMLFQLSIGHENTINTFGNWDYLSHQVIASPFKPVDYMDKMDIFGYSFIEGYCPTKSKYLVIEIKKDSAQEEDIEQLLKYVDWVKDEYAHGDYSMIRAFLVAHEFSEEVINHASEVGVRQFTIGRRPPLSKEWADMALIKYSFESSSNSINFSNVE